MHHDSIIEGTIESLAFGGQGVLKSEGLVIFVPFTAQGDHIQCELTVKKKNYAEGKLVQLLKEGPGRTTPLCPYYGKCGGCQLQHLEYDKQLSYKQQAVVDAFERIGKIKLDRLPEIHPADSIWAYRRHVTLSLRPLEKGYEAGYISEEGPALIAIHECPIFLAKDSPLFNELDTVLKALKSHPENTGRVTVLKTESGEFLFYFRFKRLPDNFEHVLQNAQQKLKHWAGITAERGRKTVQIGKTTTQVNVDGLSITFSPAAFIQNHAEQSLNIYQEIIRRTKATKSQRVLDLYCGVGITSLLIAKTASDVVGIENNGSAVSMANQNAAANNIQNITFVSADVKTGLKKRLQEFQPDLLVVNPPRGGMDKEVIEAIEQHPPKRVLYISCMPPTLARDIGALCSTKYEVAACQLYDMFPQTSHVETLVELVRK